MKSNKRLKKQQAREVFYLRDAHMIHDVDGNVVFEGKYRVKAGTFPSINAAKRKSRELQNNMGQGCVRVVS